jgi:hypothetical protein
VIAPPPPIPLPTRWYPLKYHPEHARLRNSRARFKVVVAGRRSGKTENCKREGVEVAIAGVQTGDARVFFTAPVNDQAVKIYWEDVKALVPKQCIARPSDISEGRHTIRLINGSLISVVGLDRPARIEGDPIDWIALDEFANTRSNVWDAHVRPALSTVGRPGRAWILGVPEGRNHYFRLYEYALKQKALLGDASPYDVFHWKSADIIDPADLEEARNSMDPLTFEQEFEASFVTFSGRAYYPFVRTKHAAIPLTYRPRLPLIICFDFNVEPGTAAVGQEQIFETSPAPNVPKGEDITCWIGEVWIPKNSNTPAVCRKLIADWGPGGKRHEHVGDVYIYGDATGGNRGTAKLDGSDWDIIKNYFRNVPGWKVHYRVDAENPPERSRVNAVNSRLEAANGTIHMLVDPQHCPRGVEDLEGTVLLAGGSGELEKDWKKSPDRTHWTDQVGYYIAKKHPVVRGFVKQQGL